MTILTAAEHISTNKLDVESLCYTYT